MTWWRRSKPKSSSASVLTDYRWKKLTQGQYKCSSCDELHSGIFDLGQLAPTGWDGDREYASNADVAGATEILTPDFCVMGGESFFVRAVLPLKIIGTDAVFSYGVWSTLAEKNFRLYYDTFDDGDQGKLGPWFGWFASGLKGYPDTLFLKCHVHPQDRRQRPWIELEQTDHPLAIEQRDGITLDRLLEIYAINGHDVRAAMEQ